MKLFNSLYIAKIYVIEGHAIYMKCCDGGSLRSQIKVLYCMANLYRIKRNT